MNKSTLVSVVAEKTNLTKKQSDAAVKAVFEAIKEELAAKGNVQILGFGTFKTKKRNARKGINPRTGKKVNIKAKNVPAFVAGKGLKDAVAK